MAVKWIIRVENPFTKESVTGEVSGDLDRIKNGLAAAGWVVMSHFKKQ